MEDPSAERSLLQHIRGSLPHGTGKDRSCPCLNRFIPLQVHCNETPWFLESILCICLSFLNFLSTNFKNRTGHMHFLHVPVYECHSFSSIQYKGGSFQPLIKFMSLPALSLRPFTRRRTAHWPFHCYAVKSPACGVEKKNSKGLCYRNVQDTWDGKWERRIYIETGQVEANRQSGSLERVRKKLEWRNRLTPQGQRMGDYWW